MTKTFTQNDVIRFFYNEVDETERKEIEIALLWDNDLAEFYQDLIEIGDSLNKVKSKPSDKVIENILNYSKTFSLHAA